MNVLIVDDELPAVEGTVSGACWKKLGFANVLTAYSMSEAQEVFRDFPIDVLICDIEMPRGSGIDLLKWVRQNSPETETIFLTAHANFSYARQAVQLGCLDYVLKPVVPDELEQVLDKVVYKVNQNKEIKKYRQYGQYWLQNKPLVLEKFWLDIINSVIPADSLIIGQEAEARSIPTRSETLVLPVLIRVQRWYKTYELPVEKKIETSLLTLAYETIKSIHDESIVIPVERGMFLAILDLSGIQVDNTTLRMTLESFLATCNQSLGCDLAIYIGDPAFADRLADMMDKMNKLDTENVAVSNNILTLCKTPLIKTQINIPDLMSWSRMLAEGLQNDLLQEISEFKTYILHQSGVDAQFLVRFHQDFLQMVYYVLQIKGIQAHQLFNDALSLRMSIQAVRTITDLADWSAHVVKKACTYMADIETTDTVIDRVRKYVLQHIEDDLTREEIANYVFLNPDYLSRIVKKETGLPISEYIQRQRMDLAKELLARTDLTISNIAIKVGYKHFSQFSKIFKKHVGVNPIDYRHATGRV